MMTPKESKIELLMAELALLCYETDRDKLQAELDRLFDNDWIIDKGSAFAIVGVKKRRMFIAFRGTDDARVILRDLYVDMKEHEVFERVHGGFLAYFEDLQQELDDLVHPTFHIFICGHSLGGAVALMYWAWLIRCHQIFPRWVRTYGQPRCGGLSFNAMIDTLWKSHGTYDFDEILEKSDSPRLAQTMARKPVTDVCQWVNNQDAVHQAPRANWIRLGLMYASLSGPDLEVLYRHPESIPKKWWDKNGAIVQKKPWSWKLLGSPLDHSMKHYFEKMKAERQRVLARLDDGE